jgi:HEAT repeat protein
MLSTKRSKGARRSGRGKQPVRLAGGRRRAGADHPRCRYREYVTELTKNQKVHALLVAKSNGDDDYLLAALTDPDVRTIASRLVADVQAEGAVPRLLTLLRAADPRTRSASIKALARLSAVEAEPVLLTMAISDTSPVVRSHAVGALERMGDDRARKVLVHALKDSDGGVRWCAAHVLGRIGDAACIEPLRRAASEAHFLRRRAYRRAIRRIRARIEK